MNVHYINPDFVIADLPVPHIYEDGSVNDLRVILFDTSDGAFLSTGMDHEGISLSSPEHMLALAKALTIAADLRKDQKS